jgi:hypothetical protein
VPIGVGTPRRFTGAKPRDGAMARWRGSAAMLWSLRAARHRSCPIPWRFLRDGGRICRPFHSECPLSHCGPERSCLFALIAFELVCHPEQRAEDDGPIIAGQVHQRINDLVVLLHYPSEAPVPETPRFDAHCDDSVRSKLMFLARFDDGL